MRSMPTYPQKSIQVVVLNLSMSFIVSRLVLQRQVNYLKVGREHVMFPLSKNKLVCFFFQMIYALMEKIVFQLMIDLYILISVFKFGLIYLSKI